jgi:hypothetical protein
METYGFGTSPSKNRNPMAAKAPGHAEAIRPHVKDHGRLFCEFMTSGTFPTKLTLLVPFVSFFIFG